MKGLFNFFRSIIEEFRQEIINALARKGITAKQLKRAAATTSLYIPIKENQRALQALTGIHETSELNVELITLLKSGLFAHVEAIPSRARNQYYLGIDERNHIRRENQKGLLPTHFEINFNKRKPPIRELQ